MTPPDVAVAEAVRMSRQMARRFQTDPGELLGWAWERAAKAPPGMAGPAAMRGCQEWRRRTHQTRRKNRVVTLRVADMTPPWVESRTEYGRLEPAAPDPDDAADRREDCRAAAAKALASLPARDRLAVDLYFGLSAPAVPLSSVGAVFGRTESWASNTVAAAVATLRERMGVCP